MYSLPNDDEVREAPGSQRSAWPVVLTFLIATFVHTGWLYWLQSASGLEVRFASLMQAAPTLGLATTALIFRERLIALLPERENAARFGKRFLIAVLVMVAYAAFTYLLARTVDVLPTELPYTGGVLALYLLWQLLGALGEEFGWRGFLQPFFERRTGKIWAAVIVGLIWAAWHVDRLAQPTIFIGFAITSIGISLAMGLLTGGCWWQRGLVAGFIHWILNISLFFFTDPMAMLSGDPTATLPLAVPTMTLGAIALAVLLVSNRNKKRTPSVCESPH